MPLGSWQNEEIIKESAIQYMKKMNFTKLPRIIKIENKKGNLIIDPIFRKLYNPIRKVYGSFDEFEKKTQIPVEKGKSKIVSYNS